MRDLDKNPYTADEKRVGEYITKITNDQIGWGDDPIGFMIAVHAQLIREKNDLMLEKILLMTVAGYASNYVNNTSEDHRKRLAQALANWDAAKF